MPKYEEQWFPGLVPPEPRRPGKIIVTRAEPMTIEEKEGIKDDFQSRRGEGESAPAAQAPSEPIRAPAPAAQGDHEKTEAGKPEFPGNHGDQGRPGRPGRLALSTRLIRFACSALAALAALMSWYYSFEWFRDKLPGAWRVMLPIIIVGCSVMLPQVSLIFFNKKGVRFKGASVLVLSVGILASGFSMLSTIAGIYNANSEAINRKSAALVSAQDDKDARAELVRIDAEIGRLNVEIDSTQAKVDGIAVEDTLKGDSQALMRRLNSAKRSKQDYEAKRSAAQVRIDAARESGNTSATVREDFNAFLGRRFSVEAGAVEFIMAAAPALLLDIVAPILSAVALFL